MPSRSVFPETVRRLLVWLAWSVVVATPAARAAEPPQLVIVISIDQFRADYLARFREHFGPDGFNRLLEGGAVFLDCHHQHSITKTGPGHAAMLTGVHANVNGIIGNDWIDRATLEKVSCVGDAAERPVGLPPTSAPRMPGVDDPYLARSPRRLLAATVGDELKVSRGGRPKVIGIAEKHRAAILMSGRLADAAYFMELGRMISSTYYMAELPAWAAAWNARHPIDRYFGQTWDRVLPAAAYAVQGPDDAEGEDPGVGGLGRVFPKVLTGGEASPGPRFYDTFENTPFGNDVVADFAQAAIEGENLGGRAGVTDLLCLGFSANDHIGHAWGPDSHEVMDVTIRTDRTLAAFFDFLDRRIGLSKCLIVLTADHGVSSMPERLHAFRPDLPAGRVKAPEVRAAAEAALDRAYGARTDGRKWLTGDEQSLLFFPEALREKAVEPAAAQAVVRDAVRALDCIAEAWTRTELESGDVEGEFARRMLLSFNRERSGDVLVQFKPNYFSRATGSNHGTPYNYDTHVPLIFLGPGVPPGVRSEHVWVSDLAPMLARLLGLPAPPAAEGRVLF